jgi:hypothetical protein
VGGGGYYYDRDVTDSSRRTSAGYSDLAEQQLSRTSVNPAMLPANRRLRCDSLGPIVYAFDVTGSMGTLPKIIYDKMPLIAGQTAQLGYVPDPMMCLAAVGDAVCDQAPFQVGEFAPLRSLDEWLQRLWLEGGGGGQARESYEMTAYFFATRCEIPKARTPIFLFTGDEGFRERLYKNELTQHFGGEHQDVGAAEVFERLRQRFSDNVFLIHRTYSGKEDPDIVAQWQGVLGKERVVLLGEDLAIGDVTLGLFALVGGQRTLEEYLEDMKTKRLEPQTDERVASVRASLEPLAAFLGRVGRKRRAARAAPARRGAPTDGKKKPPKPGRI